MGQIDGVKDTPSFPVGLFCNIYSFEPPVIRVRTPRPSAQIGRDVTYLKLRSNGNQIAIMVKVMLKKSDDIYYIISIRRKVEMSCVGFEKINETTKSYGMFLIILIVREAGRGGR